MNRPALSLERRDRAALTCALAAVFAVALWTRWIGLGGAVTEDEDQWIARSGAFAQGITTGAWSRTYQTGHPGVTTMWLTVLTLGPERAAPFERTSGSPDVTAVTDFLPALRAARVPFAALQAGLVVVAALLAARRFGPSAGLVAGLLLAAEPFWSAVGPVVGMDGLLSALVTVSMLALLVGTTRDAAGRGTSAPDGRAWPWWRSPAAGWAALAGLAFGLALLTKTTALLAAPVVGGLVLLALWQDRGRRRPWVGPLVILGGWSAAAALTTWLVWPAAWGAPVSTVLRAIRFSAELGGTPHGPGNFLLGQPVADPGVLFYPVALALRIGPGTVVGLLLLLAFGPARKDRPAVWVLLGFVLLFLVLLTVAAKKVDRYLLPILPTLGVLAALGWREAGTWVTLRLPRPAGWRRSGARGQLAVGDASDLTPTDISRHGLSPVNAPNAPASLAAPSVQPGAPAMDDARSDMVAWGQIARRPSSGGEPVVAGTLRPAGGRGHDLAASLALGVAAVLALGLQLWPLVQAGRYPLAAFNPLFGGILAAERAIPVGWGDGLDVAADRIRAMSGGQTVVTSIWAPLRISFGAHAPGPVVSERQLAQADFYVDYVHARQRRLTPRQLVGRTPDAVVTIGGVDYARIYRLR